MLEFTAHCNVPMIFMANVRIIPIVPSPSPTGGKRDINRLYVISLFCEPLYASPRAYIILKLYSNFVLILTIFHLSSPQYLPLVIISCIQLSIQPTF